MSVAKSYEKYHIVGDPYEHDKRQYVKIEYPCCRKSSCSKCGGQGFYLKEVRWYDEPIVFNGRVGFGFYEEGFISLVTGPKEVLDTYFHTIAPRTAWYNTIFQWFVPSTYPLPSLPEGCGYQRLNWEDISENNQLYDYKKIIEIVTTLTTGKPPVHSSYVGQVNDKIELDLVVIEERTEKGYYGDSHIYIFEDENSNRFLWKTSARKLEEGEIYHLKGTIKEHSKLEGIAYTVLTRCREG
jgi:hypothetical protein